MADRDMRKLNKEADKGIMDMCPDASYVIICSAGGKSEVCLTSYAKEGKQLDSGKLDIKKFTDMETKPIIVSSLTGSCYEFICDGGNYYLIEVPC